jgi:hypothetical protein
LTSNRTGVLKYKKGADMPQKDPEAYKAYMREQMRQRRARAKEKQVEVGITSTCGALLTPPNADVHPTSEPPITEPGPAKPAKSPEHSKPQPHMSEIMTPVEVAERSEDLLERRGWVLWECNNLGPVPEIVCIVRDELVKGYPVGYPVYTQYELGKMADMTPEQMRFVHKAKKISQGKLL